MPSSMTHVYFGQDVYSKLSSKCQNRIDNSKDYFKLFCQGSDPFMFYHFLIGKKARKMLMIQNKMHQEKTQDFFLNTILFIHKHKLIKSKDIMAFLYGYICHYYLDLYTHPFIAYKTGFFKKHDKNTYIYNGLHQEMEYMIDWYLIREREKIPHYQFKVYDNLFDIRLFSDDLEWLMNEVIGNTYSTPDVSLKYLKSIKYMKLFFRLANYDPYGIKLICYKVIDKITCNRMVRLQELSYFNKIDDKLHYLNLEHKKWCYPWDKSKEFCYSFWDLYDMALQESVNTIEEVTELISDDNLNVKKLRKIFPNLSFATGQDCNKKLKFKYFEF